MPFGFAQALDMLAGHKDFNKHWSLWAKLNKGAQILNRLPTLPAQLLIHAFVNSWLPSAPL